MSDSKTNLSSVSHPMAAFSLTTSNALFHFAGFIALSVFMSKLLFCRGSVCGSAQASIAFGAMEFLLWTASAIFTGKEVVQGGFSPSECQVPEPFKVIRDEGGPGRVSSGGLSVGSRGYTDIPLSPYRPSLDFQADQKDIGRWNHVYLQMGKGSDTYTLQS